MPAVDSETKPSWAEQVEQGEDDLPPPHEDFDEIKGLKTITEEKINDEGKRVKVVRTYKLETRKVSKTIAKRKAWRKFGAAASDPPGPNPANTIISEDVYMQFVHSKEQQMQSEEDQNALARLKGAQKLVACRYCKGDHWSKQCPYKDKLELQGEGAQPADAPAAGGAASAAPPPTKPGKYVPPSMRDGGNRRGESMASNRRDESATIRVTNLSEDTRESDLQELFRPFGTIQRIYLAKDKVTGQSKGFAFINFHRREDAAKAIAGVSGFGYDHLILKVEWAKPSGN